VFDVNRLRYFDRPRCQSRKESLIERSKQGAGGGTIYEYSKGLLNLLTNFFGLALFLRVRAGANRFYLSRLARTTSNVTVS
jgi:hypothetical protein